jgi:adenylate cyclase
MGDGFMALFNVPARQPDHATLAVCAAIEMRNRVRLWNHEHNGGKPLMHIRVGIHTGEAVVGNIGTPNLMNFTAIGREVNLAKRLEEEAGPDQIWFSTATRSMLDLAQLGLEPWQLESVGLRRVQGFSSPQEVFQIVDNTFFLSDVQTLAWPVLSS